MDKEGGNRTNHSKTNSPFILKEETSQVEDVVDDSLSNHSTHDGNTNHFFKFENNYSKSEIGIGEKNSLEDDKIYNPEGYSVRDLKGIKELVDEEQDLQVDNRPENYQINTESVVFSQINEQIYYEQKMENYQVKSVEIFEAEEKLSEVSSINNQDLALHVPNKEKYQPSFSKGYKPLQMSDSHCQFEKESHYETSQEERIAYQATERMKYTLGSPMTAENKYNSGTSGYETIKQPLEVSEAQDSRERDSIGKSERYKEITDWNTNFQNIMNLPNGEQKSLLLASIIKDFHFNARKYGEVIISEKYLPEKMKTIKPVCLGGIAGGDVKISRSFSLLF